MEQNNGRGVFYGVIGVATLIVAIVGATFAYFSATATNNDTINGTAATTGLSLTVTKVSTASGNLIPQTDAGITSAVKANCTDGNGNTVCQVYKIYVKNTGNSAAKVSGTLELSGGTYSNLKWASVTPGGTSGDTLNNTSTSTGTATNSSNTTLASDVDLVASSGDKTYYVVVWISETSAAQDTTDTGTFTGTVTFNSASGGGVTSTFTS